MSGAADLLGTITRQKARIVELKADGVYMAKLLVQLRDRFILIKDEIEDEGDRVYFGSSNDADDFREIVDDLVNFKWDLITREKKRRDLYAEMRALRKERNDLALEASRLRTLLNAPETEDFMRGVPQEAAHQIERWGRDHDAAKTPWDWFSTCGYLVQKAAAAALAGDFEKARHHSITTAALMLNWHRHLQADRPSEGPGRSEAAADSVRPNP